MNSLSRLLLGRKKNKRHAQAGFVLPTVTMVILVVVLLTTAIVFRSFDRAKNIGNYRINQQSINAALPAIDRAKAKISALFDDPNLPRGTPSEVSLNNLLTKTKYTLQDETRLRLAKDFGNGQGGVTGDGTIQTVAAGTATALEHDETLTTSWRFPVDTDNNGAFDSFTVYAILFRSPPANSSGVIARKRMPIEARTAPMDDGAGSGQCAAAFGTSASLIGSNGWFRTGGKLKKSFFVYIATVPITDTSITTGLTGTFETYKGNKSFSALEYQQDIERIPVANNAVLYEDDLDIVSGPKFRLNGRVFTNSNLLLTELSNAVELFEVSSRNSCFYEADNSKIVVGGNVGYGFATINSASAYNSNAVDVHLYQGTKNNSDPVTSETLANANKSVTQNSASLSYNNKAYSERIDFLVNAAIAHGAQTVSGTSPNKTVSSTDPSIVKEEIAKRLNSTNPPDPAVARKLELEIYFKNRTRRVPYAEVPYGSTTATARLVNGTAATSASLQGLGTDNLRPPDAWMYPFAPTDGKTGTGYSLMTLNTSGDNLLPPATEFDQQTDLANKGKENHVGDRVLIGNNLPATWYKSGQWVGGQVTQDITGTKWNTPSTAGPRSRKTRIEQLSDLGSIDRDGFWETKAAEQPNTASAGVVGGLRVVTGAGVYLPTLVTGETLAANSSKVIWSDTLPVIPPDATTATLPSWIRGGFPKDKAGKKRPFLKMRASAVYHYTYQQGKKPIACVSSYYDPTDKDTARNKTGLDDVSGLLATGPTGFNPALRTSITPRSNNGITYPAPTKVYSDYSTELAYQANLVRPNGRPVNQLLKNAVAKSGANLTLAEQAAVDSTICALQILNSELTASATPTTNYPLPHGSIQEVAFLDARQIQAIDGVYAAPTGSTTKTTDYTLTANYNQPIEQRQPLEVRTTVINLNALRQQQITGVTPSEYMLPNSGIIYATRDDALADASDSTLLTKSDSNPALAATDFKLDPTRRPNGIMLINGSQLGRVTDFRTEEKGLILASNLPVYVQAQSNEFNTHKSSGVEIGEFTGTLPDNDTNTTDFYGRSSPNYNFACRPNHPTLASSCTVGDTWRPATIVSDATTLLSSSFREGFRNEGDYNLNNNQTDVAADPDPSSTGNELDSAIELEKKRLRAGFWNNDFAINGLSSQGIKFNISGTDTTYTDANFSQATTNANIAPTNSTYFNNFVTPVQRRGTFPEYIMETCRILPVSDCGISDWVVGYDVNGDGDLEDSETDLNLDFNGDTYKTATVKEKDINSRQLGAAMIASGKVDVVRSTTGCTTLVGGVATPSKDSRLTSLDDPATTCVETDEVGWSTAYTTTISGTSNSKSPLQRIGAGTTARPSLQDADRAFARRVAFARNPFNALVFTSSGDNSAAKPLGVGCPLDATASTPFPNSLLTGCDFPTTTTATAGVHIGTSASNALWYRTTSSTLAGTYTANSPPGNNAVYANDEPLYYSPPSESGKKLVLPDVPDIYPLNLLNQNGNGSTVPPSDFSVCVKDNSSNLSSKAYNVVSVSGLSPDPSCQKHIENAGQIPIATTALTNTTNVPQFTYGGTYYQADTSTGAPANSVIVKAESGRAINAVNLSSSPYGANGSRLTLDANGQKDPIFLLVAGASNFGSQCSIPGSANTDALRLAHVNSTCGDGITMQLIGDINPNNIFWVITASTSFNNVKYPGTFVTGNFIGSSALSLGYNVNVRGGRMLGFSNISQSSGAPGVTGVSDDGQPSLVPVLQVQYPNVTTSNSTSISDTTLVASTQWQPKAAGTTTFNMVMATGDTPSHPPVAASSNDGDFNGGMPNLPRFLENWTGTATKISGSFIQLRRSLYATASFWQLPNTTSTTGLFGYTQAYNTGNGGGKVPSFEPPNRTWGYDVGLLSQIPDLFAQQFTVAPSSKPKEFFREIGRDDDWMKTLLCAVQASDLTKKAINDSERPSCT